ncbi:hypothetical protein BP00DRAFT_2101 [Aspergillus indologenus CBS 114.80]|uniref:Uncharacterized protein n=1 Tax=Aspergillus indologenus CBS 114.80 TaxID=1450541 RepID=A0A2V5JII0_9EURO|nr:hypothetical protein BP00DRAFT_2101 [Aspergillus indologenus CBS 114.80]
MLGIMQRQYIQKVTRSKKARPPVQATKTPLIPGCFHTNEPRLVEPASGSASQDSNAGPGRSPLRSAAAFPRYATGPAGYRSTTGVH